MDIAAISVLLNQGKVQQQASVAVMKLAMDTTAEQSSSMVAMADLLGVSETSVYPHLGSNIDIKG